MTSYRIIFRMF